MGNHRRRVRLEALRGASTTQYIVLLVIVAAAIGAAVLGMRRRISGKLTDAETSIDGLDVAALDGDSVAGSTESASPARPLDLVTVDGEPEQDVAASLSNRAWGYMALALVLLICVGGGLVARRMKVAARLADDETPAAGVGVVK